MIYLLTGSDDFTKKEFIDELTAKTKSVAVNFFSDATPEQIVSASKGGSLFGGGELVKVFDFLKASLGELPEDFFEKISAGGNDVVFIEESLDKRKTETKKVLSNKKIKVLEFNVPSGDEFRKWVSGRAKKYDVKFERDAEQLFFERMGLGSGDFGKELYDLWQADSELRKLKIFADGKSVTREAVDTLVSENIDENVFKLTNAIGDKNRKLAMKFFTDYMDRLAGVDDKSKIISLSALLSEQFRNILMVQGLMSERASEGRITEMTGFSSGRLFVMKKLAARFAPEKVREALFKLEILDEELKTSQAPSSLQFLMIMESVLK